MTFRMIKEELPAGGKMVAKYICNEDPRVEILVERGALSHNNPTGYTLLYNGSANYTRGIASYLTLKEAKDSAEYYASIGWNNNK